MLRQHSLDDIDLCFVWSTSRQPIPGSVIRAPQPLTLPVSRTLPCRTVSLTLSPLPFLSIASCARPTPTCHPLCHWSSFTNLLWSRPLSC